MIYGIGSTIIAILVIYLASRIYMRTKGATKGWLYLSLYGLTNSFLSLIILIDSVVYTPITRFLYHIIHPIGALLIAFFVSNAIAHFLKDFGIESRLQTKRYLQGAFFLILAIFLAMGFYRGMGIYRFDSVAMYTLAASLLVTSISIFRVWRKTGKLAWLVVFLSALVPAFPVIGINYIGSCCHVDGPMVGQAICENTQRVASPFIQYCSPFIVELQGFMLMFLLVGVSLSAIAYYLIWRSIR